MMPSQFVTKVVGVTFSDNYPSNIFSLAQDIAMMDASCDLVREPENEHDTNSIRVDIKGQTIGRIPRIIALVLAGKIDAGEKWRASVHSIVVSRENASQPGLKINVWRDEDGNATSNS